MPTRTFTGIDLGSYSALFTVGPTSSGAAPSELTPSQGVVSIFGSIASVVSPSSQLTFTYRVSGLFDFDSFPSIPDNALVTRIRIKRAASFNATVENSITNDPGAGGNFVVQSVAEFDMTVEAGVTPCPELTLTDNALDFQGPITPGNTGTSQATINASDAYSAETILDFSGSPISKADLIANYSLLTFYIGATLDNLTSSASGLGTQQAASANIDYTFDLNNFQFIVEWDEVFQFTIDPPTLSNVDRGQEVIIESDPLDPDALQLDQLTLELDGIPITPTTQTANLLIFYIPLDFPNEGDMELVAIGNGTQFSGSIALAAYTILVTNGSGIYVLSLGKTNDTLYSSERDGTTVDVKIPDPFAKTGFVGG